MGGAPVLPDDRDGVLAAAVRFRAAHGLARGEQGEEWSESRRSSAPMCVLPPSMP